MRELATLNQMFSTQVWPAYVGATRLLGWSWVPLCSVCLPHGLIPGCRTGAPGVHQACLHVHAVTKGHQLSSPVIHRGLLVTL